MFAEPQDAHHGLGHHVRRKAGVIYCRKLKDWQAKGWRIDMEAINGGYPGKDVCVIPSPRRAESGNWVFNTVPLVPGSKGSPTGDV